jgi:hypothetical protein
VKFWVLDKFGVSLRFPLGEGVFYHMMFHGELYRAGRAELRYSSELSLEDPYSVEELLRHPAELLRNAYGIPPVFMPTQKLVLSQKARDAVGDHERLHYSPVSFRHLFWLPWRFGEADPDVVRPMLRYSSWDVAFKRLQHRPDLLESVGPYYELVIYRNRDVPPTFADIHPVSLRNRAEPVLNPPIDVPLSEHVLETYPMLWTRNGIVIRHDFFERLRPFLDSHFFAAEEHTH